VSVRRPARRPVRRFGRLTSKPGDRSGSPTWSRPPATARLTGGPPPSTCAQGVSWQRYRTPGRSGGESHARDVRAARAYGEAKGYRSTWRAWGRSRRAAKTGAGVQVTRGGVEAGTTRPDWVRNLHEADRRPPCGGAAAASAPGSVGEQSREPPDARVPAARRAVHSATNGSGGGAARSARNTRTALRQPGTPPHLGTTARAPGPRPETAASMGRPRRPCREKNGTLTSTRRAARSGPGATPRPIRPRATGTTGQNAFDPRARRA